MTDIQALNNTEFCTDHKNNLTNNNNGNSCSSIAICNEISNNSNTKENKFDSSELKESLKYNMNFYNSLYYKRNCRIKYETILAEDIYNCLIMSLKTKFVLNSVHKVRIDWTYDLHLLFEVIVKKKNSKCNKAEKQKDFNAAIKCLDGAKDVCADKANKCDSYLVEEKVFEQLTESYSKYNNWEDLTSNDMVKIIKMYRSNFAYVERILPNQTQNKYIIPITILLDKNAYFDYLETYSAFVNQ